MNKNDNFGHPSGMFWYDDNFAFIPVPKNASSTISMVMGLRKNVGYMFEDKIDTSKLHTFSVVRNPYERLVSSFSEVCKLRQDGGVSITKKLPFHKINDPLKKFIQFVDDIEKVGFYDAHIQPQSYYLADYSIDRLMRFEHLVDDLTNYLKEFGYHAFKNVRSNVSRLKKDIFLDYIESTPDFKEKITNLYKKDIEIYEENLKNYE